MDISIETVLAVMRIYCFDLLQQYSYCAAFIYTDMLIAFPNINELVIDGIVIDVLSSVGVLIGRNN